MAPKRLSLKELDSLLREVIPATPGADADALRAILNNGVAALKRNAQIFDFGRTDKVQVDKSLTLELWHRKMLRLPFPVSVFSFMPNESRITLLAMEGVTIEAGDKTEATDATAMIVFSQSGEWVRRPDAFVWFECPDNLHIRTGSTSLTPCEEETEESFRAYTLRCVTKLMSLAMLLNTKGIRKRHDIPSAQLNAKRARTGKAPLDAVTYIDLGAVKFDGSSTGTGRELPMHFRRGHIRHFDDGAVTWVRDTVVKADGQLRERARYAVRKP